MTIEELQTQNCQLQSRLDDAFKLYTAVAEQRHQNSNYFFDRINSLKVENSELAKQLRYLNDAHCKTLKKIRGLRKEIGKRAKPE